MSREKRQSKPKTPTILLVSSIVVGIVGLVMLLLGIGGTAPTTFQIPGLKLDISTTSVALVVTVLGFGVAVAVLALVVAYARGQAAEKRKAVIALAEKRPDWSEQEIQDLVKRITGEDFILYETRHSDEASEYSEATRRYRENRETEEKIREMLARKAEEREKRDGRNQKGDPSQG